MCKYEGGGSIVTKEGHWICVKLCYKALLLVLLFLTAQCNSCILSSWYPCIVGLGRTGGQCGRRKSQKPVWVKYVVTALLITVKGALAQCGDKSNTGWPACHLITTAPAFFLLGNITIEWSEIHVGASLCMVPLLPGSGSQPAAPNWACSLCVSKPKTPIKESPKWGRGLCKHILRPHTQIHLNTPMFYYC